MSRIGVKGIKTYNSSSISPKLININTWRNTLDLIQSITDPKNERLRPSDCYAGVVPFVYSPGQYRGKTKTSNKANKPLKALLHKGAMAAIQHSQELKAYYMRKTAEGKNEIRAADTVSHQ